MEDLEKHIERLIGKLKSIEMCKGYLTSLEERINTEQERAEDIEEELKRLNLQFDSMQARSLKNAIRSILLKKGGDARLEAIKEEHFYLTLELKETQNLINILQFELYVIKEKLAGEDQLRAEFNKLILERENTIKESNSKYYKKLLQLTKDLDQRKGLLKEFQEIVHAGETTIKIIKEIIFNIEHHLVVKIQIEEDSEGFVTISQKTIEDIHGQAMILKGSLKRLRKELNDVFKGKKKKSQHPHYWMKYFYSITSGELLTKELLSRVTPSQKRSLISAVLDIEEINSFFTEESALVEEDIDNIRAQRADLYL